MSGQEQDSEVQKEAIASPGSTGSLPRAARPTLHVPVKETPAATAWRLAKASARSVPHKPRQVRQRARRIVDRRILGNPRVAKALVDAWGRLGRATQVSAAAQRTYVGYSDRLAARMVRTGHGSDAFQLLGLAEAAVTNDLARSPLAVRRSLMMMNEGRPDPDVVDLVRSALAAADLALDAGDRDRAATHLQDAFSVAFHRVLHFEDHPSPLSSDPEGFLAPFRASRTFQEVTRVVPREPEAPPSTRPHRVLFATASNFNFAQTLIDEYSRRPGIEVRSVNLLQQENGPSRLTYGAVVRDRLRHSNGEDVAMPESVRETLDWADTIFVEWGHRAMAWLSALPRLRARVIVRLHSYEAFTQFPLVTNWGGVHDLVFVSDHIRRLVTTATPEMCGPDGPRLHVIPNKNDFDPYALPKKEGSEFTLGMVGWGQVVKDPLWALEVLELLRAADPRWQLRLLGNDFAPRAKLTRAADDYRAALHAKIAELGDAVQLPGYTSNVAESLRRVGVIISSSHREGTHEGFLEGAASGAFPVARNWPFVARWGGAHSMVPSDWIVTTPQEAAQRILTAQTEGTLVDQGHAAAEWVREKYNWSVVGPRLDAVVLGELAAPDPKGLPVETPLDPSPTTGRDTDADVEVNP